MLFSPPPLFDLPSASVEGMVAESALRLCFADFGKTARWTVPFREVQPHTSARRLEELRVRGPIPAPVLIVDGRKQQADAFPDPAKSGGIATPQVVTCFGCDEIIGLIERNNMGLRHDTASNAQLAHMVAVETVVKTLIAPACEYLLLVDSATYRVVSPSMQRECSLFNFLTLRPGAYRDERLQKLRAQLDVSTVAQAAKVLEKGFLALERLLVASGARISGTAEADGTALGVTQMFVGTAHPTSADCWAYGAAAFLMCGRFDGKAHLAHARAAIMGQCPVLQAYVDGVRRQYFEAYGGTLQIRPIPRLDTPEDTDIYAPGRTLTLAATGGFALCYFVVVNADTIVALLNMMLAGGDDDDDDDNDGGGSEGDDADSMGQPAEGAVVPEAQSPQQAQAETQAQQ